MEEIKEVWEKLAVACILGIFVLFLLEVSYRWAGSSSNLIRTLLLFCVGVLVVDTLYGVLFAENKKEFLLRNWVNVVSLVPIGTTFKKIEEKPKKIYTQTYKPNPVSKKKSMAYKIASLHKK